MKGDMTTIVQIFASQKSYTVPIYQRPYCWKKEQVEQFFLDVMKLCQGKIDTHFIGNITIQVIRQENRNQFYIIDGQQRLTTILIFLLAVRNLIAKKRINTRNPYLQKRIEQDYLFINHQEDVEHSKLIPLDKDRDDYFQLLEMKIPRSKSNIVANYQYFYDQIPKQGIDPDQIFLALTDKLEVIQVTLECSENAQQIFESLNSTGLDLTEVDKIKNFILMNKPLDEQVRLYKTYWEPMEQVTQHKIDEFFQLFLWLKAGKYSTQSKGKFYSLFKSSIERYREEEAFFQEMLNYAQLYSKVAIDSSSLPYEIDEILYRLRYLKQPACYPFLLRILDLYFQKELSNDQLFSILKTTEGLMFRRLICRVSNQNFYTFMIQLESILYNLEGNYKNYDIKLKQVLSEQSGTTRFPNDEEFLHNFSNRHLLDYKNVLWYIFHCLENFEEEKSQNLLKEFKNKTYSVEHILPQTLTFEWKKSLGENFEKVHKEWLHRLANLTLTGYNSMLSNRSFLEKRDLNFGFKNSNLKLNQWITEQEKWDEEELKKRDEYLCQCALQIWPWEPVKKRAKDSSLNQISFLKLSF